jgi:hypothetical protein
VEPTVRELTVGDLSRTLSFGTGKTHVLRVAFPKLHLRLPIDPRKSEHSDDRFILTVECEGAKTELVQTVRDDRVCGDGYLDLIFGALRPGAFYTLVVDPGAEGQPYTVFDRCSHDELFAK